MKKFVSFMVCIALLLITGSCQNDRAVSLAVDFTSQDTWHYRFTCDIGGSFSWQDSASTLSSTIQCLLNGNRTDKQDQLAIKAEDIRITSNVLDEAEILYITDQMTSTEYSVSLNYDISKPHDSLFVSNTGLEEWDLYRQLIKVLPSLPDKPVSPGFSWDRQKQFPLVTSQGVATGEVYQSFTFDSIRVSDSQQHAYVSWLFRYAIDETQFDTASRIGSLPLVGKGKGNALINVNEKSLISADMIFTTPACSLSNLSVGWEEKASLVLVDQQDLKEN